MSNNQVLDPALEWLLDELLTEDLVIVLVDGDYTFDPNDEFLDDIASGVRIATSDPLTGKSVAAGRLTADDAEWATLSGPNVRGWWLVVDTGTEATSRLVGFADTNDNSTPIDVELDGGPFRLKWSPNGILTI